MRHIIVCFAIGSLLFSVGCDDSATVTAGDDTAVGVDASGSDSSSNTNTDTQSDQDASAVDTAVADPCDPNPCLNEATCSANTDGAAACACADGWEGDLCDTDKDECAADENPCGPNGTCTNTEGGFDCACNEGWVADENGDCIDVDECADSPCGENEVCSNTDGGYECGCADGYAAGEDGACADVDECASEESPCDPNATCSNTDGGFECTCNEGWSAQEDGSCGDVDECADEFPPCGENATCSNTDGGYECACNEGYEGDGIDCADIDECAPTDALNENFNAVDDEGNPVVPEGWSMFGSDMLEVDKEDPVLWHINAEGQLQYSNKEGTNYNGETTGAAALPSMDIVEGDMLYASVSIEAGDQTSTYYDQAWIGFLSCSNDVDFAGCLAALQEGALDENEEAIATLVPLWTKAEYNAAIDEAGLVPGDMIEVAVDLSPAAGWTGWLHFAFDSIDDYGNDGSGYIVDDVMVTKATQVCGANEGCANTDGGFDCTCLEGFEADADGVCGDIDECSGDVCAANEDCTNTPGGFECACSAGYAANEEGACVDVNECEFGLAECDANASCENTEGNYNCVCNDGFSGDGKTCENIDECAAGTDECGENATCSDGAAGTFCQGNSCDVEECVDAVAGFDSWCSFGWDSNCALCAAGGVTPFADCTDLGDACSGIDYTVPYTCTCADGYALNDDGLTCSDIDECAGDESPCDVNATCTNNEGGFDCACNDGYTGDGATCEDVNECESGAFDCDVNAACVNTEGSYECQCNDGFVGDGAVCENIDECAEELDMCGPNATCNDAIPGALCQGFSCEDEACTAAVAAYDPWCASGWDSNCALCATGGVTPFADCTDLGSECTSQVQYTCTCNAGYAANDDGMTCSDVDECAADNGGCAQICTNSDGSFACSCQDGYVLGADGASCSDVDECADNNGGCSQICNNAPGGNSCACEVGYSLGADGSSCNDINECDDNNGGCSQLCKNEVGSFACYCEPGYVLGADGLACNDVDECSNGDNNCDANATCSNTVGSFTCTCNDGYTGDGVSCEKDNIVGGGDYVGSYNVEDGLEWGGNPPGYSCLQACAQVFGGSAEDYQCSTQQDSIDNQGNYTVWGVGGCQVYDEDYVKSPDNYNCSQNDCAASAYTKDNCYGTNYCFTAGVDLPAQCNDYSSLTEADRNTAFNDGNNGVEICDKNGWQDTWYRFEGAAGSKMPTTAPSKYSCGTDAPGWLQTAHPNNTGENVGGKVCFHWGNDTCNWSSNVEVTNCGDYFVYKLPPVPACELRYCGTGK